MLAGKKTYLGIALLTVAGLLGLDPQAVGAAAGIEPDACAIAQLLVIVMGAALAAYGRWKAGQAKG